MISPKKRGGGIIRFFIYIIKLLLLSKIFIFLSYSLNAKANKPLYIVRDSEVEFFLQHLINGVLENKKIEKNSILPRVILDESYNAFVVGDNKVYINTGLIQNSNSIEEIQGVIAHELGHLFLGHIQSRKTNIRKNSKKLLLGSIALLGLSLGKGNEIYQV